MPLTALALNTAPIRKKNGMPDERVREVDLVKVNLPKRADDWFCHQTLELLNNHYGILSQY